MVLYGRLIISHSHQRQFFLQNSSKFGHISVQTFAFINTLSFLSSAQALLAPFPPFEYSLLDGSGDDEAIVNLQEHLRRRIDERYRLNMVKIAIPHLFS
jgi:hypothetical protein